MLLYYITFFDINRPKRLWDTMFTRRFPVKKLFLHNYNNGVHALVLASDYAKLRAGEDLYSMGGNNEHGIKVFTFCSARRMQEEPMAKVVYAGDYEFMKRLLREHEVRDGGSYVPFSNHAEHGHHGDEEKARELLWCTTAQDVVETFLS